MNEKTACQIREEAEVVRFRRAYLAKDRDLQTEAIIKHYVSMAKLVEQLAKVQEFRTVCARAGRPPGHSGELVDLMIGKIKEAHLYDFGIELEWPER